MPDNERSLISKERHQMLWHLMRGLASGNRYHGVSRSISSAFSRYRHLSIYLTPRKLANAILAHTEMVFGITKVHSKPYMLRIEPTNICNLRCPGCSTGLGIDRRDKGFVQVEKYEELIRSLAPWTLITRIDGLGEPFLHKELCELIRIAHKNETATVLSSHLGPGTQFADRAEEVTLSGLDHLIVSIDGPDSDTYLKYRRGGDFDLTCNNVRKLVAIRKSLKRINPLIEVQFVGFNHNRHVANQMPALVASLGADRITYKMTSPKVLQEKKASEGKGVKCFWLYTNTTVAWDGDIKLCPNSITDDFSLGNAFNNTDLLARNDKFIVATRKFLAGSRNLDKLDPILGNKMSQFIPWRNPRDPSDCRCLSCGGVGLVIDRTREWIDEYVCM
jgi:hypothetical protein